MNVLKLLFVTATFFYSLAAIAQQDTVGIKQLGLNGKVKEVTDYSYMLRPDELAKDITIEGKNYMFIPLAEDWDLLEDRKGKNQETNVTFIYDKDGRNTTIKYYFVPGKPNDVTEFAYGVNGKISGSENYLFYSDGKYVITNVYFYDDSGRLEVIKKYDGKKIMGETMYIYDSLGNLLEKVVTSDGSVTEREIRNFEKKNMIFENVIIPNKERKTVMRYDTEDNVVYIHISYPKHSVFHETNFTYEDGLLVKAQHKNDLKQETTCVYTYTNRKIDLENCFDSKDQKKLNIEKVSKYEDDKRSVVVKFGGEFAKETEYDKHGYISMYKDNLHTYLYKYQIDGKGNWTQLILFQDDVPIKLRQRTIQYYF